MPTLPAVMVTLLLSGRVWFRELQGCQGRSTERSPVQADRAALCIRTGLPPGYSARMVNTYQSVVSSPARVPLTRTVCSPALSVSMMADEPFM